MMEEVKLEEVDPLAIDEHFIDDEDLIEDEFKCCEVCNMLLIGFARYLPKDRDDIMEKGRPMPTMSNMIYHNSKGQVRYFNAKRYYQTEWLTGCEQRARLFCWACLLFSTNSDPWTTTGVADLNNLSYMIKKHSTLQHHIEAVVKWKTYGNEVPQIPCDEEKTFEEEMMEMRLKEEEVMRNREILKKLITVTCFIGGKELCSLRDEESEISDPIDQNKYEQFLHFIGKYDEVLERQLIDNRQFVDPNFRNIIFSAVSKTVTKAIIKEISKTKFVSLIMDEVAEMDDSTLVSTVVRYTTLQGKTKEKFLNFREIPVDRRADSLVQVVHENVQMLDCFSKCISLSFDGGIVQTTELFHLQAEIKKMCPNAFFFHCYEHKLVSVLAQSLSTIKECKHFFFTLNGLAAVFFKSNTLSERLNLLIRRKNPSASDFRWHFNGYLINNVCGIRQILIELFETIVNNKEDWDFEIISPSSRFLNVLTADLTFNFLLILLGDVFLRADELSSVLINKYDLATPCVRSVKDYSNFIRRKQDCFKMLYSNTIGLISSSGPSSKKMKHHPQISTLNHPMGKCLNLFNSIMSNIKTQLNSRFNELSRLSFVPYTDFKSSNLEVSMLDPITQSFHCPFDMIAFLAEASVLKEWQVFQKSSQKDVLRYIRLMNLASILPQTVTLLELYLVLPLTQVSSTLEHIENFVLCSSPAHRLSPLTILTIERDFVEELMKDSQFYDDVIEEIKQSGPSIPLELQMFWPILNNDGNTSDS